MELSDIEALFVEHLPEYGEQQNFPKWLEWADACGFLLRVYPDPNSEKPLAAAIIRPLTQAQLDDGYDAFEFDEDGNVLYIDACVAVDAEALRALGFGIFQRFGERERIAFNSHKRGIRIHYWQKAKKSLFKLRN